ncbi:FimV/HubP family polar landmark protein [Paraburkholderia sp. BCC1884]|uniref:FimV/HubP family polar landmark protein n=1 Tax=Paraburkholderia sp. BCC1884 TaxID=2562668 RepID=UPI001183816A|nr:FimV/HubP family polar landmark protein [Paraburkholderia sp. BCC1884]
MNLRFTSLRAMFAQHGANRLTAAVALAFALAATGAGNAMAAPATAASAPDAASASYTAGSQVTVRPGQSLNDVAIAVTQSHDRATLARASRALFDANPSAFMSHDPSRMRLGAVLTVPALDATGAPASDVAAASAPAATSAAAAAPAATTTTAAAAAVAATGAASGVAQVNAAAASAASAASAAAHAAAPATPAVSGAASGAAETGAAASASSVAAGGGAAASTPVAGSQAAASPASGTHEWTGSIQPSASEPVGGASAPVSGAAGTQTASQPRVQVSSLQQLLALKNRVLMELQKHGIGGTSAASGTAPNNGAQPMAGASPAASVPGHGGATVAASPTVAGLSQNELSIAAAVGAALVVLLAALRMRRRRRQNAEDEAALASDEAAASARLADSQNVAPSHDETPVRSVSDQVNDDAAVQHAAARAAAEREAAEGEAAARESAERVAAEREAELRREAAAKAEVEREAAAKAEREREAAAKAEADRHAAANADAEREAAAKAELERESAAKAEAEHEVAAKAEADRHAAANADAEHEAAAKAEAERLAATRAAAENTAAEREAAGHLAEPAQEPGSSQHGDVWHERPAALEAIEPTQSPAAIEPLPTAHHEQFDGATTAASLAAAAELGAEALPLTSLEPLNEADPEAGPSHSLQWDDEVPSEPSTESQTYPHTPVPVLDFTPHHVEPRAAEPFAQPYTDASAHPVPDTSAPAVPLTHLDQPQHQDLAHGEPFYQPTHEPPHHAATVTSDITPLPEPIPVAQAEPAVSAPTEFPRDAVDAFGSLDMPLPPRIETDADNVHAPVSLTTQPVVSPETTAQQAVAPHDPDDFPHIADEIDAGTAGHAAVAGLGAGRFGAAGFGAAGFGALKLDFDLELPPSPAQPLPVFTTADLGRIARNKLDLAAEYIELGDLSGARALINEVIEANDPATRTEARALLSTLAPLS